MKKAHDFLSSFISLFFPSLTSVSSSPVTTRYTPAMIIRAPITLKAVIFSLNIKKPYLLLNSPNISDNIYQDYLSKISTGLFSALFLMKTYPAVIKWSGSKRKVASQLAERFLSADTYFIHFNKSFPIRNYSKKICFYIHKNIIGNY